MSNDQTGGLRQPLLGILGTLIVLLVSFCVMFWFKPDTFGTWVLFIAVSCLPMQMIIAMVWQNNYPHPASKLEQPLKGLYLLLVSVVVGFVVGSVLLAVAGGFVTPPGPQLSLFMINSVVVSMWLFVVFQYWPMTAIKKHPAFIGFGTLALVYIVNWLVLRFLFDFSFLKGTPVYLAKLDGGGLFMALDVSTFLVSTVPMIILLTLLDFWPLTILAKKYPALGKQPVFGSVTLLLVLLLSGMSWQVFVNVLKMEVTIYQVCIVICWLFGQFIMMMLMQTYPFQKLKQPIKGIAVNIFAIILGFVMYNVYAAASTLIWGTLPSGAPDYSLEMWMKSAMLAVTFPIITIYSSFFDFWPLLEPAPKADNLD